MSRFCGSCGTMTIRPDQVFCVSCGASLTAPSALAPTPSAAYVEPDRLGETRLEPTRRGPTKGKLLGVVAIVLALGAGGAVGYQVLRSHGGASTAEAAARNFVESLAAQDPVGALDMVNPGEVEGVVDLYESARQRMVEEDLTSEEGELSEAVDVTFSDLDFDVDEVADNVAHVSLERADITATFDPDKLPDRLDFVRAEYPDKKTWKGDLVTELDESLDGDPVPYLTTIKVDGRWVRKPARDGSRRLRRGLQQPCSRVRHRPDPRPGLRRGRAGPGP